MTNRTKNVVYALVLVALVAGVAFYRSTRSPKAYHLQGATMGTTYHITYFDPLDRDFQSAVDSLLNVFNQSVSTYIPTAEIVRYNRGSALTYESPYLAFLLKKSKPIFEASGGRFDPTVLPLVNAWGFGPSEEGVPDSVAIDSLRAFVGFEKVRFNADSVWKEDPRVQLDFSAIAKGYGVDLVGDLLRRRGVANFFVEIGGEVLAWGNNLEKNRPWEVGILAPSSTRVDVADPYWAQVTLHNQAVATSGNYFNRYEKNGQTYAHIVDPQTGYTTRSNVLSASVFAKDCYQADAWATALMVAGYPKAIELIKSQPDLEAFVLYQTRDGISSVATPGIAPFISLTKK